MSIAHRYGVTIATLWNAPENAELRAIRPDPNQLVPGDVIEIPERTSKAATLLLDSTHRFRRTPTLACCRVRLLGFDEPLRNVDYVFEPPAGEPISGTTDDDGVLELKLHAEQRAGTLRLGNYVVHLELGRLQPSLTIAGVKARLANLAHLDEQVDDRETDEYRRALAEFRQHAGLPEDADEDAVIEALRKQHDESQT